MSADTFVQSQTFRILNKGTSAAPGNGIPFYKDINYQTRYHLGYSWRSNVMYALNDVSPPFQFWSEYQLSSIVIRSSTAVLIKTLSVGSDLREDCFNGYYIYTCPGVAISPADDCGEYRYYEIQDNRPVSYYSEIWQNIDDTDDKYKGWVKLSYTNWENSTYDADNFLDYIFYGTGSDEYRPYFLFEPNWARPFNNEINEGFTDGEENQVYTFRKVTEVQRFSVAIHDCLLNQMHQIGKHKHVQFSLIGDSITYDISNVSFNDESEEDDYIGRGTFQFEMTPFVATACKSAPIIECASVAGLNVDETNQSSTGIVVTTAGSTFGSQNDISNNASATFEDTFSHGNGSITLFKITYNPTQAPGSWTFSDWHSNITGADQTKIQNAFSGTGASYTFKDHEDGVFAVACKTGVLTKAIWDLNAANRRITRKVTYLGDESPTVNSSISSDIYGYIETTANAGVFTWTDIARRNSYRSHEGDADYYTNGSDSFTLSGAGTTLFWGLKGVTDFDLSVSTLLTNVDFTASELQNGCQIDLSDCANLVAANVDQIYIDLDAIAVNNPYTSSAIDTSGTTGNATATSSTARTSLGTKGITVTV